jgi:RNA polymerase sigma-70 factor (ECF subfamily)
MLPFATLRVLLNRKPFVNTNDKNKQTEFMQAYQPIHDNFVRFCKARAHNVMSFEDLVNESILKTYENWGNLAKKDSLLYFLFTTASNIVRNAIRKKKEGSLTGEEKNLMVSNTVEKDMQIAYLYEQLDRLSDQKKEALILFEISGFSIREIATIQESSEGAVKVMLSRARQELKELMRDEPLTVRTNNLLIGE